jgi:hypothetical protein
MERSNPDSAAARQRLVDAECPACSMLRNEARVISQPMRSQYAYIFVCYHFVLQVDRTCADLLQQQCIASFVSSCRKACSHVRSPSFILRPLSSCNLWQHVVTLGVVMHDNTTFHLQVCSFVRFHRLYPPKLHQVTSAGYEATAGERPSPSIHESLESFLM